MYINGHWYTEPELQAHIKFMEDKLLELEGKHLQECRQISEYDVENKDLKNLLSQLRSYYGETESWVDLFDEKYKELMNL